MFKRFTDCDKWKDSWFRKLPMEYKLLWSYICDQCDNAGIWKVDMETAAHFVGQKLDETEALKHLAGRVIVLASEYWLITKFVEFQFGQLSLESPLHIAVLRLIEKHTLSLPYPYPSTRVQVKDKEKDIEKERRKDVMGSKVLEWFQKTWEAYPKERRVFKKACLRSYQKDVKTLGEAKAVARALENYLATETVKNGFVKNASTFFANWRDYATTDGGNSQSIPDEATQREPEELRTQHGERAKTADHAIKNLANSKAF